MKTKTGLLIAIFFAGFFTANAQGGFQRRTVEERVKMVHDKFVEAFKLDDAKQAQADTVFAHFYQGQDKMRAEMMSGGDRPDFQAMREKMQPLTDARDKELKAILTDDQYKKWKDEIEPGMRPQRQGQGGGRNNNK